MKILFFTIEHYSHITPILSLIKNMAKSNITVYCLGAIRNKSILEENGGLFIEYPEDIQKKLNIEIIASLDYEIENLYKERNYNEMFKKKIERDIYGIHSINNDLLNQLKDIVCKIKPDFLFRDSVDIYGRIIGQILNIPRYGYITNNLYSKKFFDGNPILLYKHFLGLDQNIDDGRNDDFYKNFWNYASSLYSEIENNLKTYKLDTYHHFDPNEQYNLIFSTEFLQPQESLSNDKTYFVVPPHSNKFCIENNISKDLINFIDTDIPIVYIAFGSFIKVDISLYEYIISELITFNVKIIISARDRVEDLDNIIMKKKYKNIFVANFLPQKYILSKSSLFVTSLGFNSMLEAIYYCVPMLSFPLSSEQCLNNYIIEILNIGYDPRKKRETFEKKSIKELIYFLMNDKTMKDNLHLYSFKLKQTSDNQEIGKILEHLKKIKSLNC